MTEYLMLGLVLFLSVVGHNQTVVFAVLIVLACKLIADFGFVEPLEILGTRGLNFGVIILTAAVLVPIANGTLTPARLLRAFQSTAGIVAIIAGLLAAISGGLGIPLMQNNPDVIPALLIGTMVGVFFFNGLAVGPLIAAGFTYVVLSLVNR